MKDKMKVERKVLIATGCSLGVNLLAMGGSALVREMYQLSFKYKGSRPYGKQYRNRPFKI